MILNDFTFINEYENNERQLNKVCCCYCSIHLLKYEDDDCRKNKTKQMSRRLEKKTMRFKYFTCSRLRSNIFVNIEKNRFRRKKKPVISF